MHLNVAVEGIADEAVVRALALNQDISVSAVYGKAGKAKLDRSLPGYNSAARYFPWLVVRDLDHDAPWPGELRKGLLPAPSGYMCFRVAVREIESWLMADAESFSRFFSVASKHMPKSPDMLDDPKRELVRLASMSRRRDFREDMVPRAGSRAKEGPAYASRLSEFARLSWRPAVAARSSPSLESCLRALDRLKAVSGTI